jgi:hypothetical protein
VSKLILKHCAEDAYDSPLDKHASTQVHWYECWHSADDDINGPTGYGDTPGSARADLERQLNGEAK